MLHGRLLPVHVANSPGFLFNYSRYARIAFSTQTEWPSDRRSHHIRPVSTNQGQIMSEHQGFRAGVASIHHVNVQLWKPDSRIGCCNHRVSPAGNSSHENTGEHFRTEPY